MSKQLPFHFPPITDFSMDYYIVHSGVIDAFQIFESFLASYKGSSEPIFEMVFLIGPNGVGKKHLSHAFKAEADNLNIPFYIFDWDNEKNKLFTGNESVSTETFISIYQKLKTEGGCLVVSSTGMMSRENVDPHLASRFLSGQVVYLRYPKEEELLPIFKVLLERHHLRLPEKRVRKIIDMVPGIPQYFEEISLKINELIEQGGRVTPALLKEVIQNDEIRMKQS